jgi:hypothetical protein
VKINGKQMASQSSYKFAPQPKVVPVTDIIVGNGLSSQKHHDGTVNLEILPQPTRVYSKPIFMVGFPFTITDDAIRTSQEALHEKLKDYHVLVVRNVTDTYTAKLFSETDDDTLPISDIKKYIDQKLK